MELSFFGVRKPIYRPLVEALVDAGYTLGDSDRPAPEQDLYLFGYDWRRSTTTSARELHAVLTRIAEARDDRRVDLLCQSNAARICRYLVRYGDRDLEAARRSADAGAGEVASSLSSLSSLSSPASPAFAVEKLLLIGTSNAGSLRQLRELHRGRRYVGGIGRYFGPEVLFTLRPLFDDLPAESDDLFFDSQGRPVPIDLYDADTWRARGWSIFAPEVEARLRDARARRLFGTVEDRMRYLEQRLREARWLHELLGADGGAAIATAYYLLENDSLPTPVRAMVDHDDPRSLAFGDHRAVSRSPELLDLAMTAGDGHATLESQRALAPAERAALREVVTIRGGHFEAIVQPRTLAAIVRLLGESSAPAGDVADQPAGARPGSPRSR
mgnify:FL=1